MNTHTMRSTIDWPAGDADRAVSATLSVAKGLPAAAPLRRARHYGFRVLLASLPALVIVTGAAWSVSTFASPYVLQAMVWAAGFVFLALAIESRQPNVGALLATGLALPVLAVLSAQVATEFAIIAAALVAGWIAATILKL